MSTCERHSLTCASMPRQALHDGQPRRDSVSVRGSLRASQRARSSFAYEALGAWRSGISVAGRVCWGKKPRREPDTIGLLLSCLANCMTRTVLSKNEGLTSPSKQERIHQNEGGPMRVEDLNIGELVEFDSEDGVVRFAGQRALISTPRRKATCARSWSTTSASVRPGHLTRFRLRPGLAHGRGDAGSVPWESEETGPTRAGRITCSRACTAWGRAVPVR